MTKERERMVLLSFGNESGDLNEELLLDDICQSEEYYRAVEKLNTLFKFMSLKLADRPIVPNYSQRTDVEDRSENRLVCEDSQSDPPIVFRNYKVMCWLWKSKLTRPIISALTYFTVIKLMLISILRFKHDSFLKDWHPILRENATRTDKCALKQDLSSLPSNIKQIQEWLTYLGDPTFYAPGTPILIYQYCCILYTTIYIALSYLISKCKLHADCFAFIISPHSERHRVQRELDKLAGYIMKSVTNLFNDHFQKSHSHDAILNLSEKLSLRGKRKSVTQLYTQVAQHRAEVLWYFKYLMSIAREVKPANLSAEWHRHMRYLTNLVSTIMILSLVSVASVGLGLLTMGIVARVKHRLNTLECQAWQANSTFINDAIPLNVLKDALGRKAYEEYDGSIMNLLHLIYVVELKEMLDLNIFISIIQVSLLHIFASLCMFSIQFLYCLLYFDRIRWLNQVEQQVIYCAELSRNHHFQNELKTDATTADDILLTRLSTITYLNFLLFKNQFQRFLPAARSFITIILTSTFLILLVCYSVAVYSETVMNFIVLIGISFFMLQIGFYVITAAYLLEKITNIVKHISRLAIYSRNVTHEQTLLTDLWRRQLTDSAERKKLFGIKVLGSYISYGLFLSASFYMILLWIMYFRASKKIK